MDFRWRRVLGPVQRKSSSSSAHRLVHPIVLSSFGQQKGSIPSKGMSSACRISKCLSLRALSTPIRPKITFRATPPSCRCRTFLSRRRTSFWAPSYPESKPLASTLQVPFTPPPPTDNGDGHLSEETRPEVIVAEPRDKKNRYLNSLMEKAGELSLKCSILDAEGNWGTEGQKYTKLELCREYDLDVSRLHDCMACTDQILSPEIFVN